MSSATPPLPPTKQTVFWEKKRCGKQMNKTHHLPHSSAAEQKQRSGVAQSVAASVPLPCLQTGSPPLIDWAILNVLYNLIYLSLKGEMRRVIVKITLLTGMRRCFQCTQSSEASVYFGMY